MAVAICVNGHDHIAALGKLHAVQVLHLGRVVIAMAGYDGGCLCIRGSAFRDIQKCAQVAAVLCDKADILNLHFAAACVRPLGQCRPEQDQHKGRAGYNSCNVFYFCLGRLCDRHTSSSLLSGACRKITGNTPWAAHALYKKGTAAPLAAAPALFSRVDTPIS